MKPMVSLGEAHISSIVAAYEVGTLTSKVRPVAWFSASAMISPPATIAGASTDGTNRTLIGCSGLPTSGIGSAVGSGGASVGAAVATAGASVAAGVHAPRAIAARTSRLKPTKAYLLLMGLFPPLESRMAGGLEYSRQDGSVAGLTSFSGAGNGDMIARFRADRKAGVWVEDGSVRMALPEAPDHPASRWPSSLDHRL